VWIAKNASAILRSEEGAFDTRRHPVALEARLAERVHDHDLGSPLPREIEVFHEDRLSIRDVGAEQDDEIALDHVAVRACRRGDANRLRSAPVDGAWHTRAALSMLFVPR